MSKPLSGKRALVTGAASGIGQAAAIALAAAGAKVAVHARSSERAKDTLAAIESNGDAGIFIGADLMQADQVREMCDAARAALGGIDVVVHNAGIAEKAPVLETEEDMWDRTMFLNVKVPYLVTQQTLPAMIEAGGGRQIYISSIAGKLAEPIGSAYVTSKAALLAYMRCVAADMGKHGITSNAICPGWTDTPMAQRLHEEMPGADDAGSFQEFYEADMRSNMLGALIAPSNIADAVVFLAGPGAGCVTAQALNVDGGLCLS